MHKRGQKSKLLMKLPMSFDDNLSVNMMTQTSWWLVVNDQNTKKCVAMQVMKSLRCIRQNLEQP